MKTELIDEISGITETRLASLRPSPKVRLIDALLTVAIFGCLAVYVICGALILYHHLY